MNGVLLYHKTLNGKTKTEILNLASNCYAHVIRGQVTFKEWAKAIKEYYDITDKRNEIIYNTINSVEGVIGNYPNVGRIEMRYKKFK